MVSLIKNVIQIFIFHHLWYDKKKNKVIVVMTNLIILALLISAISFFLSENIVLELWILLST